MADMPVETLVQWEEFLPAVKVPDSAKLVALAKSPDGTSLSMLFEGLEVRCKGEKAKTAITNFSGSIAAVVPSNMQWKATRGDVQGQLILNEGVRANLHFGLGQAVLGRTQLGSLETVNNNTLFIETLYTSVDRVLGADGSVSAYGPLTLSVQLEVFCNKPDSEGLAIVDSIDVELWLR